MREKKRWKNASVFDCCFCCCRAAKPHKQHSPQTHLQVEAVIVSDRSGRWFLAITKGSLFQVAYSSGVSNTEKSAVNASEPRAVTTVATLFSGPVIFLRSSSAGVAAEFASGARNVREAGRGRVHVHHNAHTSQHQGEDKRKQAHSQQRANKQTNHEQASFQNKQANRQTGKRTNKQPTNEQANLFVMAA